MDDLGERLTVLIICLIGLGLFSIFCIDLSLDEVCGSNLDEVCVRNLDEVCGRNSVGSAPTGRIDVCYDFL